MIKQFWSFVKSKNDFAKAVVKLSGHVSLNYRHAFLNTKFKMIEKASLSARIEAFKGLKHLWLRDSVSDKQGGVMVGPV